MEKLEKQLFFKSIYVDLKNVRYDRKNNPSKDVTTINVIVRDNDEILDVTPKGFKLLFERSVTFNPEMIFDLKVSYEVSFDFDTRTINEYKNDFEGLKELINVKREKALNMTGVISKASTLISNITVQNNGNAIVTPPTYSK